MDPFDEARVKNRYSRLLNKLKKTSKFTFRELETLALLYSQMKDGASFDRGKFKVFVHNSLDMTDSSMNDRIYENLDRDEANWISINAFIRGMGIYLRGSQQEQADFCFSTYDIFKAKKLTRGTMYNLLRLCITRAPSDEDADEGAKDLVELLFKFCDQDNDGSINLAEFRKGVSKEPLLMETLGQCLPDRYARDTFSTALAETPPSFY
ncbi:EF-hand calcium-binding domain-containing protein 1-like [Ischnura elegans]|uniref:EF-hand calcium-binding domain-containing protein 1-like n=1 Tax=Ischnura elegans TaxID=197161 RepID=UPI001ED8A9B8|nr:EF-hand calcium-binding domain-containing protein 1-like [Ischnura elegans]